MKSTTNRYKPARQRNVIENRNRGVHDRPHQPLAKPETAIGNKNSKVDIR